jgi:Na+/H+ antiporter NhaD/arsenite permease-like protein
MLEQPGLVSSTDPVSQALVALAIVGLFFLLAREAAHRVLVAMVCVALLWLVSYLTPYHLIGFEAATRAIDMNVLLLLAGMMAVVGVLKSTGAFGWAVAGLMRRARGDARVGASIVAWFTGILSAFLDNVTTVIFVTPMAIGLARRMRLAPAALLLPMVVASNIGGTATLIGDPPNVMIGSGAGLTFVAFLATLTAPVLVMMAVSQYYTRWYYRDEFAAAGAGEGGTGEDLDVPLGDPVLFRWMGVICAGIVLGFLTHGYTGMPVAVPAVIGATLALVAQDMRHLGSRAPSAEEEAHGILQVLANDVEWPTLSFFVFLFIMVGAAVETGLVASVASGMGWSIGHVREALGLGDRGTLLFAALLVCWVSAVLSAFIDNIPYVAVSIPIIHRLIPLLAGETQVLWWALALGACLGGNATAVGASANVTTLGLAEREGIRIGFNDYGRFAAPLAMLTIVVSSLFLTSFVYLGRSPTHLAAWALAVVLIVIQTSKGARPGPAARLVPDPRGAQSGRHGAT